MSQEAFGKRDQIQRMKVEWMTDRRGTKQAWKTSLHFPQPAVDVPAKSADKQKFNLRATPHISLNCCVCAGEPYSCIRDV